MLIPLVTFRWPAWLIYLTCAGLVVVSWSGVFMFALGSLHP